MRLSPLLHLLLALCVLFGAPAHGRADRDGEFRRHYQAALRLYGQSEYEEAIKEFQAAYTLKQLPRVLLNLGQTHRKLGHAKDALGFYEFYLRVESNPKPEIKVELETYIRQTREMLAAAERMQKEQSQVLPEGDQSEPAPGTAPQARVEPAPGGPAGVAAPVGAAPNRTTTPTASPEGSAALSAALKPTSERHADQVRRPVYKKWWFWSALGVAAAGAATGIALGARSSGPTAPTGVPVHDPAAVPIHNAF